MDKKLEEIMKKNPDKLKELLSQIGTLKLDGKKEHKFWRTQPVPLPGKTVAADSPVEEPKNEIRKTAYNLPPNFEWTEVDINIEEELNELYVLLSENYVEDTESLFRFDYPDKFLDWALKSPGWRKEWHIGIRKSDCKELVAFVIVSYQREIKSVEVNFLCVHKSLRSKRITPVLIKEITRKVNLTGIFQALYTAGVLLPTPISTATYYHRTINSRKLIETGFSYLPPGKTMTDVEQQFKLPSTTQTPGLRPMEEKDVNQVCTLFRNYSSKFKWSVNMNEDEIAHWLLPRKKVVYSYVVEKNEEIVDFFSFYLLPSTIVGESVHSRINAAYLLYYSANEDSQVSLILDALILARDQGCDVFNCLNIMDNSKLFEPLKFGRGDGDLHYYMFNWSTNPISPSQICVMML